MDKRVGLQLTALLLSLKQTGGIHLNSHSMLMYFDTRLAETYGPEEALMLDLLISLPRIDWAGTSNLAANYWQAEDTYIFEVLLIDFNVILPFWGDKKCIQFIKNLVSKKALRLVKDDGESYKVAFSKEMMTYLKESRAQPKKKFLGIF